MRYFIRIALLILIVVHQAAAEFMVINTKKGYAMVLTTYQQVPMDTLQNGRVVFCDERNDKGLYITYMKNNNGTVGYLNPSDAMPLSQVATQIPSVNFSKNTLLMEKGMVKVVIVQKPFDEKENIITPHDGGDYRYQTINGKSYGKLGKPVLQLASITIRTDKGFLEIAKDDINDIFEPLLEDMECYYSWDKNSIYLSGKTGMINSAGKRVQTGKVIWVVENGTVKERFKTGY